MRTEFRYDAQNRVSVLSDYSSTSLSSVANLVYSAGGRTIRSYRYASGTPSPVPSKVCVFDSGNRLVFDSTYFPNSIPLVRHYFKYSYNAYGAAGSADYTNEFLYR